MDVNERLQELLDHKDEEIEQLKRELTEAQEKAKANYKWTVHVESPEDLNPELPIPRLELRYESLGERGDGWGYFTNVRYDLVMRHFLGHVVRVPLGGTRMSTKLEHVAQVDGRFDLPHRDGAHIMHDMVHLNFPAFVVVGSKVESLDSTGRWGQYKIATGLGQRHKFGGES